MILGTLPQDLWALTRHLWRTSPQPRRTWAHVPVPGHRGRPRLTNDSCWGRRCACAAPARKRREGAGGRTKSARAASKPRPTWAPPRDAGAHRGKARSSLVGYLQRRDRACVGLPGHAPRLVEWAHAYWPNWQRLEEAGLVGEARGVCVPCAGVFSPASSLGAVGTSKGDLDWGTPFPSPTCQLLSPALFAVCSVLGCRSPSQ